MNKEIESYEESVEGTIANFLKPEKENLNKLKDEAEEIKNKVEEEYEEDPFYIEKMEEIRSSEETIEAHEKSAKYLIEQIIKSLRKENKDLASKYIFNEANKRYKEGEKELRISNLQNDNISLGYKIKQKENAIKDNKDLMEKYTELGDFDRVKELRSKGSKLNKELEELKENHKENENEISNLENAEKMYKENLEKINYYKEMAKNNDIEIDLKNNEKQEKSEDRSSSKEENIDREEEKTDRDEEENIDKSKEENTARWEGPSEEEIFNAYNENPSDWVKYGSSVKVDTARSEEDNTARWEGPSEEEIFNAYNENPSDWVKYGSSVKVNPKLNDEGKADDKKDLSDEGRADDKQDLSSKGKADDKQDLRDTGKADHGQSLSDESKTDNSQDLGSETKKKRVYEAEDIEKITIIPASGIAKVKFFDDNEKEINIQGYTPNMKNELTKSLFGKNRVNINQKMKDQGFSFFERLSKSKKSYIDPTIIKAVKEAGIESDGVIGEYISSAVKADEYYLPFEIDYELNGEYEDKRKFEKIAKRMYKMGEMVNVNPIPKMSIFDRIFNKTSYDRALKAAENAKLLDEGKTKPKTSTLSKASILSKEELKNVSEAAQNARKSIIDMFIKTGYVNENLTKQEIKETIGNSKIGKMLMEQLKDNVRSVRHPEENFEVLSGESDESTIRKENMLALKNFDPKQHIETEMDIIESNIKNGRPEKLDLYNDYIKELSKMKFDNELNISDGTKKMIEKEKANPRSRYKVNNKFKGQDLHTQINKENIENTVENDVEQEENGAR